MGRISSFVFTTLNGYYKDLNEDTGWHHHGEEEAQYSEESLASGDTLLFGRINYERMKSFWPTSTAAQMMPKIAEGMNKASKLVVSRTLQSPDWKNTQILGEDWVSELREIKKSRNITLLGSGSILTQLTDANLLDELQIMINPTAIGRGHAIFQGLKNPLSFRLKNHRIFNSGIVLLTYSKLNSS